MKKRQLQKFQEHPTTSHRIYPDSNLIRVLFTCVCCLSVCNCARPLSCVGVGVSKVLWDTPRKEIKSLSPSSSQAKASAKVCANFGYPSNLIQNLLFHECFHFANWGIVYERLPWLLTSFRTPSRSTLGNGSDRFDDGPVWAEISSSFN